MSGILSGKWEGAQRRTMKAAQDDPAPDVTNLSLQKTGRPTSQTKKPVSLSSLFPNWKLG